MIKHFAGLPYVRRALTASRRVIESATGVTVATADLALSPFPIPPEWILEGQPRTMATELARNGDGTTVVYLWKTTTARFHWHHQSDETIVVLDGEAYVSRAVDGHFGPETRIGPGDVAFFRAGEFARWRVPDHLAKVSTLTRPAPAPVAVALKWGRLAKRGLMRALRPDGQAAPSTTADAR